MPDLRVELHGLREMRTNLRRMDRGLPRGIKRAGDAAARIVAGEARGRLPTGPTIGGHAASSIRPASTQSAARVRGGGARFAYFGWLEFGGILHNWQRIARTKVARGRYLYPSFLDRQAEVEDKMLSELAQVGRNAGLPVRERG